MTDDSPAPVERAPEDGQPATTATPPPYQVKDADGQVIVVIHPPVTS